MIKQFDLLEQYSQLKPEIDSRLANVFSTCQFCLGPQVREFETRLAKYLGAKHAIGVSSGSAALTLSLKALDIGQGDGVVVPANTYIATAFAVSHCGATPIFVDNDEYYNLDIKDLERKITFATKAIMAVHLYGLPANMNKISMIAKKYDLKVIEDSAQALGAEYEYQKVGTLSDIGCFSFYPAKNLGCCGDGGMVVTDNDKLNEKLRQLRDDGRTAKYTHKIIGHNNRLDEIQAAILNVKLKYLDEWNRKRQLIANIYTEEIWQKRLPIIIPKEVKNCSHIYHQYVIRIENRDKIRQILWDKYQIGTGVHYPIPVHQQEAYKGFNDVSCPSAERNADKLLSLPMYPELSADSAIKVIEALEKEIK